MPAFLTKIATSDKSLAVFVELYKFSLLVIQCWESQRIANHDMYIHSIKETLPYLFAFNRYNYQQSALEFLADLSLLGDYHIDLLRSGIMFEALSAQPGKQVSCGYVLEIYNKIIKQTRLSCFNVKTNCFILFLKKYFQLRMFFVEKSNGYKKILGKKNCWSKRKFNKKISIEKKIGG